MKLFAQNVPFSRLFAKGTETENSLLQLNRGQVIIIKYSYTVGQLILFRIIHLLREKCRELLCVYYNSGAGFTSSMAGDLVARG